MHLGNLGFFEAFLLDLAYVEGRMLGYININQDFPGPVPTGHDSHMDWTISYYLILPRRAI